MWRAIIMWTESTISSDFKNSVDKKKLIDQHCNGQREWKEERSSKSAVNNTADWLRRENACWKHSRTEILQVRNSDWKPSYTLYSKQAIETVRKMDNNGDNLQCIYTSVICKFAATPTTYNTEEFHKFDMLYLAQKMSGESAQSWTEYNRLSVTPLHHNVF